MLDPYGPMSLRGSIKSLYSNGWYIEDGYWRNPSSLANWTCHEAIAYPEHIEIATELGYLPKKRKLTRLELVEYE